MSAPSASDQKLLLSTVTEGPTERASGLVDDNRDTETVANDQATGHAVAEELDKSKSLQNPNTSKEVTETTETKAHAISNDPVAGAADTSKDDENTKAAAAPSGKSGNDPEVDLGYYDDNDVETMRFNLFEELRRHPIRNLKSRRENARQRLLQGASYAALVEDRIAELEQQVLDLKASIAATPEVPLAKDTSSTVPGDSTPPATEGIPPGSETDCILGSIKMTWKEFTTVLPKDTRPHLVEFLVETPPTVMKQQETSAARRRQLDAARTKQEQQVKVERMRINSVVLCDILGEVMGKDVAPINWLTMLRPFKCILVYWNDVLKCRDELREEVKAGADAVEGESAAEVKISPAGDQSHEKKPTVSDESVNSHNTGTTETASNSTAAVKAESVNDLLHDSKIDISTQESTDADKTHTPDISSKNKPEDGDDTTKTAAQPDTSPASGSPVEPEAPNKLKTLGGVHRSC